MSHSRVLPALTGLRGVCALWVLTFHSHDFLHTGNVPIISMGWMGVDIFFVLSGFIISHVHISDFRGCDILVILKFYAIRLSRVYPVHIFTMLLAFMYLLLRYVIGAAISEDRFSPQSLLRNLLLIQSWNSVQLTWNYVSWSISAEWAVYLAFPAIALLLSRIVSPFQGLLGFVIMSAAMISVLAYFGYHDTSITTEFTLVRAFGGFVGGCFLYTAYRNGGLGGLPWGTITTASVSVIILVSYTGISSFWAIPPIGPLVIGLAYGTGPIARLLSTRLLMFLGEVSYSLYMVHFLILEIVFAPVHFTRLASLEGFILYPTYVAGLLCVGAATIIVFRYVERPGRTAMRRLLLSRLSL
jgi:peptidoglycan/LPS O-acetylase OafA/YrhL